MLDITNTGSGHASWDFVDGAWEINIYSKYHGPDSFTVTAFSGSNPIRYIHITSEDDCGAGACTIVALTVVEDGGTIPSIESIERVPSGTYDGEIWISSINISSGYIGDPNDSHMWPIDFDVVGSIIAPGGIYSDITAGPRKNGVPSTIALIRAANGPIQGDIIAHYGNINQINAGGAIGAPGDFATIQAKDNVLSMTGQTIYANIKADWDSDQVGTIRLVKTTGGDFAGNIYADAIDSPPPYEGYGLHVAGDFYGTVKTARWFLRNVGIGGDGYPGALPATSSVIAGYNLGGSGGLRFFNDDALEGQVIINAQNAGSTWDGPVIIGTHDSGTQIQLGPVPYYDNKSADIGGGAVGLVPYYCYYIDCTPVAHKVDEDRNTGLDGLDETEQGYHAFRKGAEGVAVDGPIIRHYGPVERVGTGKPFTVRAKLFGSATWTDITDIGSGFAITMHPDGDERAYKIDGPFMPGYDYLIEPRTDNEEDDYLACGGLDISDVAIKDYDFRFRVFKYQDINLDTMLRPNDISAWLAEPEDTTRDGVIDYADLVDVTEAVAESDDL